MADRKDPYRSLNFLVEIDAVTQAGFQECSGLDTQTSSIEYREGADPKHVRKLQGLNSFTNISLKRGITDSTDLWDWYRTGDRRSGSIVLLDDKGVEKMRWNFVNAWPTKWTGPSFNAMGNAVAIEALEIAHEEIVRP
jgi:phage tail-like protein